MFFSHVCSPKGWFSLVFIQRKGFSLLERTNHSTSHTSAHPPNKINSSLPDLWTSCFRATWTGWRRSRTWGRWPRSTREAAAAGASPASAGWGQASARTRTCFAEPEKSLKELFNYQIKLLLTAKVQWNLINGLIK